MLNRDDIPTTEENVTDRYLYGMLARFIRPYWKEMLVVLVLLLASMVVALLPPYLIQRAVDGPIARGSFDELLPYGLLYLALVPTLFLLRFGFTYTLHTVGQSALMDLRQVLFEHILKQDMKFFTKTPVGQLVSRLSHDIEAMTELASTSFAIVINNMINLVGIVGFMFILNWRLALISLSMLPIMIMATALFRVQIRNLSRILHKLIGDYQAFVNEQVNGMLEVQLFGRQELSRREFETINREYRDTFEDMRDWYTYFASFQQILTAVGLAVLLYGGGNGVLAGWATLGMLISFIQYSQRTYGPVLQLSEQYAQIQSALSAGERIARMLHVMPEIQPKEDAKPIAGKLDTSVRFENVHFHYDEGMPVIRGINLDIPAGQRVAIVGATGAGKTSMAGLIARFYDVVEGSIKIGGVDVRDLTTEDLRRHVMVVPQAPYCFGGTIADNLKLFKEGITDEQMELAAEAARAADFIERLPGKYNFELLPGAANLSQGQRQLLALARALLHNPDSILVLDEATSNIDTETEALIQDALETVLANRTSITIAHRLSTVREADRILVMKHGEIVEDGNHYELMAQGGLYANLVRRQFAEAGIDEAETQAFSR